MRKNIFCLNWTQGLATEWLSIQLYVTRETFNETVYSNWTNYARRWFRKDRKCCDKHKPFSLNVHRFCKNTWFLSFLHICMLSSDIERAHRQNIRKYNPISNVSKWLNVSYHYVKSETSGICRTGAYLFFIIYFTFILSKLEFGFYKSHIYGLFTPVKSTFPNKYN